MPASQNTVPAPKIPLPASGVRNEPIPLPTVGGKQFWNDEIHFHKWRVQRNVVTGHCRLLDEKNRRHAWGTLEACERRLDEIRREQHLPPMKGRVVIVLHGLLRSRGSMNKLCEALQKQGRFQVLNVEYASTQGTVADHARSLARIVDHLDGVTEIDFVAHSMGNIVIRRYLFDKLDPATGRLTDPRFKRMVMLGPPNHGSELAQFVTGNGPLKKVDSMPGHELGPGWATLSPKLAVPPLEFGIVAGGRGDGKGFNPVLPGDDDATVRVASARLAGATDFTLVPVLHSFLMDSPDVIARTVRFLQHGYFVAPDRRQPIGK